MAQNPIVTITMEDGRCNEGGTLSGDRSQHGK